jgi:large subunit ribosomal protein L18
LSLSKDEDNRRKGSEPVMANQKQLFERRRNRVRYRILQVAAGRPRLSVYRSGRHIYAQVIDDGANRTIAAASSGEAAKSAGLGKTYNVAAAAAVGKLIAARALEKGVKRVVFDRAGYLYHGRVKALADAARQGGLEF